MMQVDGLLRIRQGSLAVYSDSELIPELLPVDDVSIELGYIEFWEFNSMCHQW